MFQVNKHNITDILSELTVKSATSAIKKQHIDGSFLPGRNNSWNDNVTPARTTSHYAIQLCKAYSLTKNIKYLQSAELAYNYLTSPELRPFDKTFNCRTEKNKNKCNGLIGQAWVIESLIHGAKYLRYNKLIELARSTYKLHEYNQNYHLYSPIEINGRILKPAKTLNHQLIFTAVGCMLIQATIDEHKPELLDFYKKLPNLALKYKNGILAHHVHYGPNSIMRNTLRLLRYPIFLKTYSRAIGYHSFNLFSLGLAKSALPGSDVWDTPKLRKLIEQLHLAITSKDYLEHIKTNSYAYAYRLVGPELLVFCRAFGFDQLNEEIYRMVSFQLDQHWDKSENSLSKNTPDSDTLASRLYEICYLI